MQRTHVAEDEQQFCLPDETIETDEETFSNKHRAKRELNLKPAQILQHSSKKQI